MADELDSGSSVGSRVWVQVPSPASHKKGITSNVMPYFYSTVTTFAKLRGLSTSNPLSDDT